MSPDTSRRSDASGLKHNPSLASANPGPGSSETMEPGAGEGPGSREETRWTVSRYEQRVDRWGFDSRPSSPLFTCTPPPSPGGEPERGLIKPPEADYLATLVEIVLHVGYFGGRLCFVFSCGKKEQLSKI